MTKCLIRGKSFLSVPKRLRLIRTWGGRPIRIIFIAQECKQHIKNLWNTFWVFNVPQYIKNLGRLWFEAVFRFGLHPAECHWTVCSPLIGVWWISLMWHSPASAHAVFTQQCPVPVWLTKNTAEVKTTKISVSWIGKPINIKPYSIVLYCTSLLDEKGSIDSSLSMCNLQSC